MSDIITKTTSKAPEKGTYIVSISFTDDDGNPVSPDTMVWTLLDHNGNIVNNREQVSISSPSISEDIVLSGDDLAIIYNNAYERRRMVFEGTYTSNAGAGLPMKGMLIFEIVNLDYVK